MPPYRTMRFNPKVTVDDALLLSEYMDREQLPYEDAAKLMNNDVSKLRSTLEQSSVVRFGELGTFNMNISGNISFEVDANGIDDADNFGFEPFAIAQLRKIAPIHSRLPPSTGVPYLCHSSGGRAGRQSKSRTMGSSMHSHTLPPTLPPPSVVSLYSRYFLASRRQYGVQG